MEPLNKANGYSSKNAFKGRLVFGLYGKACPKASQVESYLSNEVMHAYLLILQVARVGSPRLVFL